MPIAASKPILWEVADVVEQIFTIALVEDLTRLPRTAMPPFSPIRLTMVFPFRRCAGACAAAMELCARSTSAPGRFA